MIGAILGDIIGSPYEFDAGDKTKDFPLFSEESQFTDDTVMTLAVAQGFMDSPEGADDETIRENIVRTMHELGQRYPNAGYGGRFGMWLFLEGYEPYNSFGNGSAMRVSSAAWLYDNLDAVRHAARLSAEVTHNHPEGIKGAESTAAAIFLARTGHSKDEIKTYIEENFGYDLNPEAIIAFLEGSDFEDVIRTAVSLGGDCDTLAAIAGSIAEAFYGVPEALKEECRLRLPEDMRAVLERFDGYLKGT